MKQIFANATPVAKAGTDVALTVNQDLDSDRLKLDEPASVNVRIDGPQTALLADMIAGVYPAPGSEQSPDEFLPHIALTRRTLPWERGGPDNQIDTPWLALMLFSEAELRQESMSTAPGVMVTDMLVKDVPEQVTRNRLMVTCKIPGPTKISTLTVANTLLAAVRPTIDDLRLLSHVKRATVETAGPEIDDEDTPPVETDIAIVVCNRLPNSNAPSGSDRPPLHLAVLVSIERASELFLEPMPPGSTTLHVLHHWTFRPTQGGDFEQVIKSIAYRPHGGVQRYGNLPASVPAGESAPLSGGFRGLLDHDGYFLTGVEHDQDVNATYRGPLRPFGPQPRSKSFAISAAPNEFTDAPQGKPLDFAHAAAFELGRLLALHDPAILEDLRDVGGTMNHLEPPVAINKLPPALQKPDWVVNPQWTNAPNPDWAAQPWQGVDAGESLVKDENLFLDKGVGDPTGLVDQLDQWNLGDIIATVTGIGEAVSTPVVAIDVTTVTESQLETQFADVQQLAAGIASMAVTSHLTTKTGVETVVDVVSEYHVTTTPDGLEFASPDDMTAWVFDGIKMPARLWEFLTDIRLLRRIPLGYLVPDPNLLPPESIRFFHVNQTWVDRVIDGAFSTTNVGTVDFHYSLTALQMVRDAIDPAPQGMTGLLIRSELVRRWPKMIVRAFDTLDLADEDAPSTMKVLRAEPISRDVFIALFAGQPKRVHIREPFDGVRYGVEGTSFTNYTVDQRDAEGFLIEDAQGNSLEETVTARNQQRRNINLEALRDALAARGQGDARGVALHLEQRPFVQIFRANVAEAEGSIQPPLNLLVSLNNGKNFTLSFASQALFQLED